MKSLVTSMFGVAILCVGCAGDPVSTREIASNSESTCGSIPLGPVCNNYQPTCTSDAGWVFWPNPEGTACTTAAGHSGMCDGGDPGPPSSQEPLTYGQCVEPFTLDPHYYVVTVIYSPPGRTGGNASTVSYGEGSTFSSQTSITKTWKNTQSVKATVELPFVEDLLGSVSVNGGFTVIEGTIETLALRRSIATAINHTGPPIDGIDHDEDEIYLWLNPRVYTYDLQDEIRWTLDVNPTNHTATDLDIQYVKVAWLKGTQPMPPGVEAELTHHGITPAHYPALLAHSPFADGSTFVDPDRFERIGMTFPYEAPTVPNGTPDAFPLTFSYEDTNTAGVTSTREYTVGLSATFPVLLPAPFKLKFEHQNALTYSRQRISTNTLTETETATAMIRGPAYGYTGSSNVTVYFDTINKTFMFEFVPIPTAPALRGLALSSRQEPLVHEMVYLQVGGREFKSLTNRSGEYRFFDHAPGPAEVRLTDSAIRRITLTSETQVVNLTAAR